MPETAAPLILLNHLGAVPGTPDSETFYPTGAAGTVGYTDYPALAASSAA